MEGPLGRRRFDRRLHIGGRSGIRARERSFEESGHLSHLLIREMRAQRSGKLVVFEDVPAQMANVGITRPQPVTVPERLDDWYERATARVDHLSDSTIRSHFE